MELVTRELVGMGPDGPRYARTWTGRSRAPESVAEWVQLRVASLGSVGRSYAAGRLVVALLEADDPAAVKAAVAAGKDLGEFQRYSVLRTLQACRASASESYGSALPFITERLSAWSAKWGEKPPQQRRRVA